MTLTDTGVTNVVASPNLIADDDDVAGANGNAGTAVNGDDAQVLAGTITYTLGDDADRQRDAVDDRRHRRRCRRWPALPVNTTWVAGQLIGHTGSDASIVANRVFTITVSGVTNSGAAYDMVLLQPVKHTTSGTEDNTAPFTVNVVVTDADGSTGHLQLHGRDRRRHAGCGRTTAILRRSRRS